MSLKWTNPATADLLINRLDKTILGVNAEGQVTVGGVVCPVRPLRCSLIALATQNAFQTTKE